MEIILALINEYGYSEADAIRIVRAYTDSGSLSDLADLIEAKRETSIVIRHDVSTILSA